MTRRCPVCSLVNPISAQICDCGHDFTKSLAPTCMIITGISMTWGATFWLCFQFVLCAIPALWLGWIAWQVPSMIYGTVNAVGQHNEIQDLARRAQEDAEKVIRKNPLR